MYFAPQSPSTLIIPLNQVLKAYEGFRTVSSFVNSGLKNTVDTQQHGLSKKVAAIASSIILAIGIALSSVPLTLHLTLKVIQSKEFIYDSSLEKTIAKMVAITMLPGIAAAFVLFSLKALIQETVKVVKEPSHPEHQYEPYNPPAASYNPEFERKDSIG